MLNLLSKEYILAKTMELPTIALNYIFVSKLIEMKYIINSMTTKYKQIKRIILITYDKIKVLLCMILSKNMKRFLSKKIEFECVHIPESILHKNNSESIAVILNASKDVDHFQIELGNIQFHKTKNDKGESILLIKNKLNDIENRKLL